jgi:methionine-rich copper-binding protein CopC
MLSARRILSVAALTLILSLSLASVAFAHAEFVSAVPAPNSTVSGAPSAVKATYSEAIDPKGASITVTGPSGTRVDANDGHVDLNNPDRTTMLVTLKSGLPAGKYTVHWTTLALDGDSLSDTFVFTIAAKPAAVTPSLPRTGGLPVEVPVVGGLALAAAGLALRRRGT